MKHRRSVARTTIQVLLLIVSAVLLVASQLWAQGEEPRAKMGFWDILMLPRVWMGALFCLMGIVLLAKAKATRTVRNVALGIIFLTFTVLATLPLGSFARGMGLHPSPVCTVTKPFLFINAHRAVPIVFPTILFTIAVFTIAGNKSFCGWVCPLGALQELVHQIPPANRRRFKLPFKVTNWIRVVTYVVFVPLVFIIGKSIYDYFNPFEALHWGFELLATSTLLIVLVAAFFIFRPFCYLFCPIGLVSWLLEQISLSRVEVDPDKCTVCYECTDVAPCPAMRYIVDGARFRPDCHACGRCLNTCSEDAIKWVGRSIFRRTGTKQTT